MQGLWDYDLMISGSGLGLAVQVLASKLGLQILWRKKSWIFRAHPISTP